MRTNTSGKGSVLVWLLWAIIFAAVGAFLALRPWKAPHAQTKESATLSVLQIESLQFLVTKRVTTQIVVTCEESDWLSSWRGVLWATVKICYGLDLQRITPRDIRSDGDVLLVRVPEPELFDLSVVAGSIGFLSKSSAVAKLQAFLHDGQREELEGRLRKRAMEFAVQNGMLPSRGEILRELNEAAKLLDTPGRQKLRFE